MSRHKSFHVTRAIVGIDPGSERCGYGVLLQIRHKDCSLLESGVWDIRRKKHEGGGMQMVRLGAHMQDLLERLTEEFDAVYLAYEEIRFHGENAGVDAAHGYGAVIGQVTAACEVNEVPYTGIPPNMARKLATGRGDHNKEQVRKILEGEFGSRLGSGDRRVRISKKNRKCSGLKTRIESGYDESDAVCVALALIRQMGWA